MKRLFTLVAIFTSTLVSAQQVTSLTFGTNPPNQYTTFSGTLEWGYKYPKMNLVEIIPTIEAGTVHKGDVSQFWCGTDEFVFTTVGTKLLLPYRFSLYMGVGGIMNIRTNWTVDSPSLMAVSELQYVVVNNFKSSLQVGITTHSWNGNPLQVIPTLTYSTLLPKYSRSIPIIK